MPYFSSRAKGIWPIVGVLILTIWIIISYDLERTRRWLLEQSHLQLESLTKIYAEEVSSFIVALNYVLVDLREQWDNNPEEFGALVQSRLTYQDPSIVTIGILDADGKIIFSSADWRAAPVNLSDRAYFQFHRRSNEDLLHIERPVLLRVANQLAIVLSRQLPRKEDTFSGVITLAVSLDYFSRFHQGIHLGADSVILLAKTDGVLIARYPRPGLAVDTTVQDAPWIGAQGGNHGFFTDTSELDQIERLHAWRVLNEQNMVVSMGQAMHTILAPYHRQRRLYLWGGGMATLLLLVAGLLFSRHHAQQEKANESLRKMEEALERSQKLESIGKMTGGVAHDFNNILQIISSNVQLLEMELRDHVSPSYLKGISDAVDKGGKLAAQLLTFARRQPLHPVSIHMEKLLKNMDSLIQRLVGPDVEVKISASENLWYARADPSLLENVIFNLAANARDAMDGKGSLTIELGNASLDKEHARFCPGIVPGDYVILAMKDTGAGMPPEVIRHVFEPFFTTKPEGKGTGLGLATAYGFVNESGGCIHIESQVGVGTVIKIFLPRSKEPDQKTIVPLPPEETVKKKETILMVEDNAELRRMMLLMLDNLEYQVLSAADFYSAVAVLEARKIDVLFTDVMLPGSSDGIELAKQAKLMQPHLKIILASGALHIGEQLAEAFVEIGDVYFLAKPYNIAEVDAKLRKLLNKPID